LHHLFRLFATRLRSLTSNGKGANPITIAEISLSCFDSISISLFEEHRRILRFLLRSHFTDQQLAKLNWRSLDIKEVEETPAFDVWELPTVTDCYTPVALLVSRGSFPVHKQLDCLARTRKENVQDNKTETILHVYSVTDVARVEIDPILQSGDWIVFENVHLALPLHTRIIEDLLLKIGKTEGLHRSFRIFFVVTLDD
uniref:Dynein heavy chain region D6 P-loop domain-containing protein n=1 Tax=Parascaris univalens TaxID=6257 RepID=A0A915BNS5_PARUN